MAMDISYVSTSGDGDWSRIVGRFCDEQGDGKRGIIADSEFDRLYDHVAETISRFASFSDDSQEADFTSSRYVDQVPWISVVAGEDADPRVALKAALEAIRTAHRPVAVSFDFDPDYLLVLPPDIVHSSFGSNQLRMTPIEIRKRRGISDTLLRNARAVLPVPPASSQEEFERLDRIFSEMLRANEHGLALDHLEEMGLLTHPRGGFWRDLERVALNMELPDRALLFRKEFGNALDRMNSPEQDG
jgi:hypothetical protein